MNLLMAQTSELSGSSEFLIQEQLSFYMNLELSFENTTVNSSLKSRYATISLTFIVSL